MNHKILDSQRLHPKEQIVIAMTRIYERGLTTLSGGNISVIDEAGDLWISPSGIDKGNLTPDDIMCVKKNGEIVGKHKPSSEYPFHRAIYQMRPDLKALIHAHPPALVSYSIIRQKPNANLTLQAKKTCGEIGYAPYELPGSEALGAINAQQFNNPKVKAIIMENHGTVLGGSDIVDAYARFETFEFCAAMGLYSSLIGKAQPLTDEQIDAYYKQLPTTMPTYPSMSYTSVEKALRTEICQLIYRGCNHNLMFSSAGTVSARTEGNDFLITPAQTSRWELTPDQLVQIKEGKAEAGKTPSEYTWLHQKIYSENPDVNAIICSQPPYLMSFGITDEYFNVRTIPESWIFLQDVHNVPVSSLWQENEGKEIREFIKKGSTAVLVRNATAVVVGASLMKAFDYLEVAECSAKSIVQGVSMGKMVAINDAQVAELREHFKAVMRIC